MARKMSHYSHALQKVIDEYFDGRQAGLAEKSEIPSGTISKHCSGDYRPDLETLEKICKALKPEVRARLVSAHLQDETPPSARYYLTIKPLPGDDASRVDEKPSKLDGLDRKTRKAIEFIAEKAIENKDAKDALQHTAKFLGCEL